MRRRIVLVGALASLGILSAASAEPAGSVRKPTSPVYRACPADKVWSDEKVGCVCADGLRWDETVRRCTATCPPGKVQAPNARPGTCVLPARTCPPGKRWSEAHDGCVVVCPAGKAADAKGTGCVADPKNCPADTQWYEAHGRCLPFCAPGKSLDYANGTCVDDAALGQPESPRPPPRPVASGAPKPAQKAPPAPQPKPAPKAASRDAGAPQACPEGREWKPAFDGCVPICPADQVLDFYGIACHPIRSRR